MPDLVITNRRAATCCGRFTARPTCIDTSWSGGAGMFTCSELLLCPRCAYPCKPFEATYEEDSEDATERTTS